METCFLCFSEKMFFVHGTNIDLLNGSLYLLVYLKDISLNESSVFTYSRDNTLDGFKTNSSASTMYMTARIVRRKWSKLCQNYVNESHPTQILVLYRIKNCNLQARQDSFRSFESEHVGFSWIALSSNVSSVPFGKCEHWFQYLSEILKTDLK